MSSEPNATSPPWIRSPHCVVNWWDMERFSAYQFIHISSSLTAMGKTWGVCEDEYAREHAQRFLRRLQSSLEAIGCQISAAAAWRFGTDIDMLDNRPRKDFITIRATELRDTIVSEMKSHLFMWIPPHHAEFFRSKEELDDRELAEIFPFGRSSYDAEEARKCFGAGRYTASVLHSMRVLETGLSLLAKALKVPFGESSWNGILTKLASKWRQIETRKRKPASWKRDRQFYNEAFAEFRYFKDAWRNYSVHGRATYDEARAKEILLHVQSFMRHLATRLKES